MSECKPNYHCATCPIRRRAAGRPKSVYARIHRWHSSWNQAWKAYQAHLHATSSASGE